MPKKKEKSASRRRGPPSNVNVRRNAASAETRRNAAPKRQSGSRSSNSSKDDESRRAMTERVQDMGGSHVAAGLAAGTLGNVLGVMVVGLGWVGPKTTAGVLMGTGVATTAAGYYLEADHVMTAGAGLTAAGTFSLVNQYAVGAYEALEKKAKDKKEARENEERKKRMSEAQQAALKLKQRNAGYEHDNAPYLHIVQEHERAA